MFQEVLQLLSALAPCDEGRSVVHLEAADLPEWGLLHDPEATELERTLLGHLSEMVVQSRVTAEVYPDQVPIFDGVLDCIHKGMISGAIERNREYASQYVSIEGNVKKDIIEVFYDPQTSGGLLIVVKENKADELISRLKDKGIRNAAIIGKIISKSKGNILLKKSLKK